MLSSFRSVGAEVFLLLTGFAGNPGGDDRNTPQGLRRTADDTFSSRGAYKGESFGFYRSGGVMKNPAGVAYFATILYVLDGETGLILRYRLSADVPH